MFLYYKLNNEYIKFECNNFIDEKNYNNIKLAKALKNSLMRKYKISIDDYILNNTDIQKIEKCGFCDEYSYYDIIFNISLYKKSYLISISDIEYNNKFYCKSKNKNCEGKKYNPNSVIFVSKTRKISTEDALKNIHERNKSPFYSNNYETYDEYKKYQSLQNRLSDDKYESFIKKLKYSKTIEYYIEKYGENDGIEMWNNINSKKDSMSFNYILTKNNNDYKKSIIEYKNRVKSVMPAEKVYLGGFYSKSSFDFFEKLKNKLKLKEKDILYGENEFFIEYFDFKLNKKRKFYYDFVDFKNNVIIEYNGLRWHPNKYKMTKEQYDNWYHPFNKELSKEELEEKDVLKENIAKNNNYDYIIIWDCDNLNNNLNTIYEYYKNKKQK